MYVLRNYLMTNKRCSLKVIMLTDQLFKLKTKIYTQAWTSMLRTKWFLLKLNLPAQNSTECSIFFRVEVLSCDNYWEMCHLWMKLSSQLASRHDSDHLFRLKISTICLQSIQHLRWKARNEIYYIQYTIYYSSASPRPPIVHDNIQTIYTPSPSFVF